MLSSSRRLKNCTSSPSLKYIAFWSFTHIQLLIVYPKQKIQIANINTFHISFNQTENIMIYTNSQLQLTVYSISFKKVIYKYKATDRIIKTLHLHPQNILMTLSSKGYFQQCYKYNKLIKQMKGSLWDDQRIYDFVYSKKHKLLILAFKSGELIFKDKQLLTKVYIHTPFHSLTLNKNQNYISAVCKNQIFIFEIFTEKRYYVPMKNPSSLSWMNDNTIAVLGNQVLEIKSKPEESQEDQYEVMNVDEIYPAKVISIWNIRKQKKIREKVISEYAFKLVGQGENINCVYLTQMESEEGQKSTLAEWFRIQQFFGDFSEIEEIYEDNPVDTNSNNQIENQNDIQSL